MRRNPLFIYNEERMNHPYESSCVQNVSIILWQCDALDFDNLKIERVDSRWTGFGWRNYFCTYANV